MENKELKRYLNVIKRAVSFIEGMMENDDGGLLEQLVDSKPVAVASPPVITPVAPIIVPVAPVPVIPPVVSPPVVSPPVEDYKLSKEYKEARSKHIKDLMGIDCWPESVPNYLVAKDASVEDQINRANAVLDMMLDRKITNSNFLDFGCGDGWISQELVKRGVAESTGYDIKFSDNWSNIKDAKFTNHYNDLKHSYYDFIMLYDVLDHCEDPIILMEQVKRVLKKEGVVYVRCHPWTSKHATHLYKQGLNKAYMHLFLSYEEIKELVGCEPTFARIEKNPLEAYRWWFKDFEVLKERPIKEIVSDFFHVESFKELLANEQQIPLSEIDSFLEILQIQFVDFCLKNK